MFGWWLIALIDHANTPFVTRPWSGPAKEEPPSPGWKQVCNE